MAEDDEGLRQRLTRQGEEAVGKLAQDLLENPLFANTLARAFEAREKAMQAQTVAMGALNLPSAADIETLLTVASRVPDHGKLVPWRFIVFEGEARLAAGEAIVSAGAGGGSSAAERSSRVGATSAPRTRSMRPYSRAFHASR